MRNCNQTPFCIQVKVEKRRGEDANQEEPVDSKPLSYRFRKSYKTPSYFIHKIVYNLFVFLILFDEWITIEYTD